METYQSYYGRIEKPFFAPEPEVFGIAWGIIYPLIFIAFGIIVFRVWQRVIDPKLLMIFGANMVANFAFTPLQLNYPETPLATIDIIIVLLTLAWLQWELFTKKQWLPFSLLVPYLLWAGFATVLQVTIFVLNFA